MLDTSKGSLINFHSSGPAPFYFYEEERMTNDLELEVRSANTLEDLKEAMLKLVENSDLYELDERLTKLERRLSNVEDSI